MDKNEIKQIFNEKIDTYVMCSTQNQIVNYIPFKIFDFKQQKKVKIVNIKIDNQSYVKEYANSEEWDKWFDDALSSDQIINNNEFCKNNKNTVSLNRNFNYKNYKSKIKSKIKDSKRVIWNITGGQRSVVIAIKDIFRERIKLGKKDYLIYLEGNTNKIIYGYGKKKKVEYEEIENNKYEVDEKFSIEKALSLAGFHYNLECSNLLDDKNKTLDLDECILDRIYKEYINNPEFRKLIIATGKENADNFDCVIGDEAWDKLEKENADIKKMHDKLKEAKTGNSQILGYFLEVITTYKIKNVIKEDEKLKKYFKELKYSLRVINDRGDLSSQIQFCEFDIVLLSKAGQLIFFECKGGLMGGETARARHYTSYAVGGVYGTPIIVTPLLKDEIDKKVENNIYKNIYSCIDAAKRANMDVWGIDELDKNLIDFLSTLGE